MGNGRDTTRIKRTRNELLVSLNVVYPGALQAKAIFRGLLVLFPDLEFDHFRRDLMYLFEKKYVERVTTDAERDADAGVTPWRKRWYRLTAAGLEVADHCVRDPALDES